MTWTCKYCGQDTSNIDYDYLDGYNHLSCTLEFLTKKMKTRINLKNPDKINSLNYCLNGDTVEINYNGYDLRYNDMTGESYIIYKFAARKNRSSITDITFELYNDINPLNQIQLNTFRYGSMQSELLDASIVKNKDKFLNTLIDLVNKQK